MLTSTPPPDVMPPDLAVRCPICASKPGEKCASLITAQYRDEVHPPRREAARRAAP